MDAGSLNFFYKAVSIVISNGKFSYNWTWCFAVLPRNILEYRNENGKFWASTKMVLAVLIWEATGKETFSAFGIQKMPIVKLLL